VRFFFALRRAAALRILPAVIPSFVALHAIVFTGMRVYNK
jgi:hypothetical protein